MVYNPKQLWKQNTVKHPYSIGITKREILIIDPRIVSKEDDTTPALIYISKRELNLVCKMHVLPCRVCLSFLSCCLPFFPNQQLGLGDHNMVPKI